MKRRFAFVLPLLLALAPACNAPAYPERDGAAYLRRQEVAEETVQAVVRGDRLEPAVLERVARYGDDDVRFLIARNPHLPREWMERFANDTDDYVRSGLAQNRALPPDLVERLLADTSHTVWVGLARNPGVAPETHLRLLEQKRLDLAWFAMNPNCPPEIERLIRESGDESALYWLDRSRRDR